MLKGNGLCKISLRVQNALQAQVSEFLVQSSEFLLSQLPPFNSWSDLVVQTITKRRKRWCPPQRAQNLDLKQVSYFSPCDCRGSMENCVTGGPNFMPTWDHEVNQSLHVWEKSYSWVCAPLPSYNTVLQGWAGEWAEYIYLCLKLISDNVNSCEIDWQINVQMDLFGLAKTKQIPLFSKDALPEKTA